MEKTGRFLPFPQDFTFGSAVSSFQVEGESGQRDSDWDEFLKDHTDIIQTGEKGPQWWVPGKAEEDIDRIKTVGVTCQRLSLEWARIEPEEGKIDQAALKRYHQIFDHLHKKNIKIVLTINHYTLPDWVSKKGSWGDNRIVSAFEKFTKLIVSEFGSVVSEWLTLNEPGILVEAGYLMPVFPPQRFGIFSALSARGNMLEAHRRSYAIIKQYDPSSKVSMAFSFRWYRPRAKKNFFETEYAKLVNYLDSLNYVDAVKDSVDFIGVNFYTGFYLELNPIKLAKNLRSPNGTPPILFGEEKEAGAYISDFLGPMVPDFFLDLLRTLQKRYNKPIVITENGVADRADQYRAFYILTHLVALWKAINEGIGVSEYIHWSTVDNLEWREGYRQEFGLIHVNQVTGERTMRKSANLYGEIIKAKGIDIDGLIREYLPEEQRGKAEETIEHLLKK